MAVGIGNSAAMYFWHYQDNMLDLLKSSFLIWIFMDSHIYGNKSEMYLGWMKDDST